MDNQIQTKQISSDVKNAIDESQRQIPVTPLAPTRGYWLVNSLAGVGMDLYPWWSPARDRQLNYFWQKIDYLSSAIYTMCAKMTAISFHIEPRYDMSVKEDMRMADYFTDLLYNGSEYGEGWPSFYDKFLQDLLCCDNGAFSVVIGDGNLEGPLVGPPLTVVHLDSLQCQRTGDPIYPVLYLSANGYQKIHYSRIMFRSQMPSARSYMYGVGMCAVSRAVNVSQTLFDVLVFKREKLGSRPHRAILVPSGGLDPEDISLAFQHAEESMDSMGLSRFSKVVVAGSSTIPDAKINVYDLASMPDGFNEETSIQYGMAAIALAIGVDARELWPAIGSGASRADALLQHLKQRGKGPGQIIELTERLFSQKFLPPNLRIKFDYQDEAQDRESAEIALVRTNKRRYDLQAGVTNTKIAREDMLQDGDITQAQFEKLELEDGRLVDGTNILALFYSEDPSIKSHLDLGVGDPLDVSSQDPLAIMQLINEKLSEVSKFIVNSTSNDERWPAYKASKALSKLYEVYRNGDASPLASNGNSIMPNPIPGQPVLNDSGKKPDDRAGRVRDVNLLSPNPKNDFNSAPTDEGMSSENADANPQP